MPESPSRSPELIRAELRYFVQVLEPYADWLTPARLLEMLQHGPANADERDLVARLLRSHQATERLTLLVMAGALDAAHLNRVVRSLASAGELKAWKRASGIDEIIAWSDSLSEGAAGAAGTTPEMKRGRGRPPVNPERGAMSRAERRREADQRQRAQGRAPKSLWLSADAVQALVELKAATPGRTEAEIVGEALARLREAMDPDVAITENSDKRHHGG